MDAPLSCSNHNGLKVADLTGKFRRIEPATYEPFNRWTETQVAAFYKHRFELPRSFNMLDWDKDLSPLFSRYEARIRNLSESYSEVRGIAAELLSDAAALESVLTARIAEHGIAQEMAASGLSREAVLARRVIAEVKVKAKSRPPRSALRRGKRYSTSMNRSAEIWFSLGVPAGLLPPFSPYL